MPSDLLTELGYTFLGSRLKRLAERLQADAWKVSQSLGVDAQPAEIALLAAIDRFGPMTVSEVVESLGVSQPGVTRTAAALVKRGAILAESDARDQRQKTLKLTRQGRALVTKAKKNAWPLIDQAVASVCRPLEGRFLDQLAQIERQLAERSLETRALELAGAPRDVLSIREYSDDMAEVFYAINAEWIESMFVLEHIDREMLSKPRETILDRGGSIFFVESAQLGVIGTCALMPIAEGVMELTKLGVLERARGHRAGKLLVETALARARALDVATLFLLTNAKCATAIKLYEQLGFEHDAQIMEEYGAEYARCNVAMRYRG
jgi:DNA-binding MarR family transcriptional regulator